MHTRTLRSEARVGAKMLWIWNLQRHKRYRGWSDRRLLDSGGMLVLLPLLAVWMLMLMLRGRKVLLCRLTSQGHQSPLNAT